MHTNSLANSGLMLNLAHNALKQNTGSHQSFAKNLGPQLQGHVSAEVLAKLVAPSKPPQASTLPANNASSALPSEGEASTLPTNQGQSPTNSTGATNANALSASATKLFDAQGNLTANTKLQDFALLDKQVAQLSAQALQMANTINSTQIAAMSAPIFRQLNILQKLFESLEQVTKQRNELKTLLMNGQSARVADGADEALHMQSQILSLVWLERLFKLLETQNKPLSLSRLFKKGPLGENAHEENTDDELGLNYGEYDEETDYIKRPRHENKEMETHLALLMPR